MLPLSIILLLLALFLIIAPILEVFFKKKLLQDDIKTFRVIFIYVLIFVGFFTLAKGLAPTEITKQGARPLDIISYYGTVMTAVGLILTFIETTRSVKSTKAVKNTLIHAVTEYDHQHCLSLLGNLLTDIYSSSHTDAYLNFKIIRKILLKSQSYKGIMTDFNNKLANPNEPPMSLPKDPNEPPVSLPKDPNEPPMTLPKDPNKVKANLMKKKTVSSSEIEPPLITATENREWLKDYIGTNSIKDRIDKLEAKLILLSQRGKFPLESHYKTDLINEIIDLRSILEKEARPYDSK